MATWKLHEAKGKFSELVTRALKEGPQDITVRGELVAVVISRQEYTRLTHPKLRFLEFMRHPPFIEAGVDFSREQSPVRKVAL